MVIAFIVNAYANHRGAPVLVGALLAVAFVGWLVSLAGYFIVNPNEARVIQLFGDYLGTVTETGLYYGNPFYTKTQVSMRVQNFETGMTGTPEVKGPDGKILVTTKS